ncbi:Lrp/AsnC family transcriptional regulator [Aquipuribacter sp. SD81]|uniref:Lrp/AsnC family transcriptional regulator n=1 Tax=Aquipuribacter sp. SD81 TaxID=3127703 RepID=UPI003018A09A
MPGPEPQNVQPSLDDVDRALLEGLRADGRATNASLAALAGIAESTCASRLRALRRAGVVTGSSVDLDAAALGHPLRAVVKVRLGTHDRAHVAAIYDHLVAVPGVLSVLHLAGEDDFLVHVAVPSAERLRDLVLEHVTSHPSVRQVETHLVFEERRGVGVPLRPEAAPARRSGTRAPREPQASAGRPRSASSR